MLLPLHNCEEPTASHCQCVALGSYAEFAHICARIFEFCFVLDLLAIKGVITDEGHSCNCSELVIEHP